MKHSGLTRAQKRAFKEAAYELHAEEEAYKVDSQIDFIRYLVTMLLVLFSIRAFIGEPVRVDGDSMYDTLLNDERMVIEKISYLFREPRHGDIIVCYSEVLQEKLVKRVIGIPGDVVEVKDGFVYRNGEMLQEDYIYEPMYDWQYSSPVVVPERQVYVMGDNRNYSLDSRQKEVGCIPYEEIWGHVIAVMWPLNAIRGIA